MGITKPEGIREEDGQRFLDLSIYKSGEQYRSFMHVQTRAQHLFSASIIIAGVVSSAVISAKADVTHAPGIILWAIPVGFVLTLVMCSLVIGSSKWNAGPPLGDIEREYLKPLYERGVSVAIWLVGQMDKSYQGNRSTQKRNGWYLNIAAVSVTLQLLAIGVGAYFLGKAN